MNLHNQKHEILNLRYQSKENTDSTAEANEPEKFSEKFSSWLTTIALTTLAFLLSQFMQIKIRGIVIEARYEAIFALVSLTAAAGIGLLFKLFLLAEEFVVTSEKRENSKGIIFISLHSRAETRVDFDQMFTGLLSGKRLKVFRLYLLPTAQGFFLYGGIMYAASFMLIFLFDFEPSAIAWARDCFFMVITPTFYLLLYEKNPFARAFENIKIVKFLIDHQIKKNISNSGD